MQKRPFSRLIAMMLSIVMILTMLPIIPFTAHAAEYVSYSAIHAGDTFDVYVSQNESKYYMFVPVVSGTYTFYSSYYDSDPWGYVLNSSMESINSDDDSGDAWNFSITRRFEAGETYYLMTCLRSGCSGWLTLNLVANELDEPLPEETPNEPEVNEPEGERNLDVWDGTASMTFAGGSGTEYDPFIIGNASDLACLAKEVNNGYDYADTYFKLTTDIDLAGLEWTPIGKSIMTSDFSTSFSGFAGHFDGNGHIIYNLKIDYATTSNIGLFGVVLGTVRDLGIVGVNMNTTVSGNVLMAGSVVGTLMGGGYVGGCFAEDVNITASAYSSATAIGSVVGFMPSSYSVVENCYGQGVICGTGFSGGVVGMQYNATGNSISNCYFNGTVKNSANTSGGYIPAQAGGISNSMGSYSKISNCFFVGEVANSYGYRGPINGDNRSTPTNSY